METSRQAVEQNLAQIATATVSEKIPVLMDYYLGFDLIEKNDQGTRAAGIMGFKIGKELVYIPVFFLNGKVKGTEVMYLKGSDVFISSSEQWVNYIIAQSQMENGEAADEPKGQVDSGEVSKAMQLFVRPPASASKTASVVDYESDEVDSFIDLDKARAPYSSSLINFIKAAGSESHEKIAEVLASPEIFSHLIKFYSPKDFEGSFFVKKAAAPKVEEPKEVEIVHIDSALQDVEKTATLSDKEKADLFSNGYIIKNAKEGKDAAKLYIEDEKERFNEVTESGIYKVLNAKGQLIEAAVFVGVVDIEDVGTSAGGSNCKLILDTNSAKYYESNGEVYYRCGNEISKATEDSRKEALSGGKSVSSVTPGKRYLIISPGFSAYGPLYVNNKTTEKGKVTLLCSRYEHSYSDPIKVRLVDTDDTRVGRSGDTVYIPSSFKFFELSGDRYCCDEEVSKLKPGCFATVLDALTENGSTKAYFEKSGNDIHAVIDGESYAFSKRAALVLSLCKDYDLSVESAEKVANKLYDKSTTKLRIAFKKEAYPAIPEPSTEYGATREGTPMETQGSTAEEMLASSPGPQQATDPEFGTWEQPGQEDLDLLERASDANSREVFDPAMVGILVRTTRTESIVQEYIPEFVDNLDRMIRLLLLFYWHNAEFADDYGLDEMAEFEDLLQTTIKSTGKTILFLKQKAVESSKGNTDVL